MQPYTVIDRDSTWFLNKLLKWFPHLLNYLIQNNHGLDVTAYKFHNPDLHTVDTIRAVRINYVFISGVCIDTGAKVVLYRKHQRVIERLLISYL